MTASRTSRKLARAPILAVETPEGAGATVRRSIGGSSMRSLSPFLMLDHFKVGRGAGFPDHPHRGQITVTLMKKGYFRHEDSKGHSGFIGPGDMQWMKAGRGIVHAEMPYFQDEDAPEPEGLQLWVDLPHERKLDPPNYTELTAEQITAAHPTPNTTIKVIAGAAQGSEDEGLISSPVAPEGEVAYYDFTMAKAGEKVYQPIPSGWNAFIYTMSGSLYIGPEGSMVAPLKPFHTAPLSAKDEQDGVWLESASDDTNFVLIAGKPIEGPPSVQHGPFVAKDQQGIRQAFVDYQSQRNGFENSHSWASEIGGRKLKA